jgi:hypothetical protein
MAKRNSLKEKARRRAEREARHDRQPPKTTSKWSVCFDCDRYTVVYMPAMLCAKCCRYYEGE